MHNIAKAMVKRKLIDTKIFIRKEKRFQTINLTIYLKKVEKEEHVKAKSSSRKIIFVKAVKNGTENEKIIEKLLKPKAGSLER